MRLVLGGYHHYYPICCSFCIRYLGLCCNMILLVLLGLFGAVATEGFGLAFGLNSAETEMESSYVLAQPGANCMDGCWYEGGLAYIVTIPGIC